MISTSADDNDDTRSLTNGNNNNETKKGPLNEEQASRIRRPGAFYVPIIQLIIFLAKLIHGYLYVDQTINFDAIVTSILLGMSCVMLLVTIYLKKRRMGHTFNYYILASSFGTLGAGILLRQLDSSGVLCKRNLPISGHAWWHVLTALTGILLYFFLRSERILSAAENDANDLKVRPRTETEDTRGTAGSEEAIMQDNDDHGNGHDEEGWGTEHDDDNAAYNGDVELEPVSNS